MSRKFSPVKLSIVLLTALVAVPAASDADAPKKLTLGEYQLQLNGTGYRKKSLLSLYEGSLYLQQPSRDASAIVEADQAMAIRIRIVSGFVSQSKLVEALNEGFQHSPGGRAQEIVEQINQFRACFGDEIKKNDVFVLSYIPGAGVLVHKNGRQKGLIPGLNFKQALFGIWLSKQPADAGLRDAMLGR